MFKDETYVLAPDFDLNMFANSSIYNQADPNSRRFYQKLIDNTLKSLNKKQTDEFANRLADSLKNYWDLVYRFGGAEKWNGEELKKRAEYTPFGVLIDHALRRGLFSDENLKFKKSISPDNQVLLNNSGFFGWGFYYNFTGQRFEDIKLITPFIPRQNAYLYGNDEMLFNKFEKDFGRKFNFNIAFKDAEHPDVLFELRSGKIHPTLAMQKLKNSDLKYIIPKHDFKDLSISEVYDILSARNIRWEQWQVMSMMNLIVDKVPDVDNGGYLDQILSIINVNSQLFLKDTNDNHKLWLKIEDKFRAHIDRSKEYTETLKRKIEKLRSDIKANESDINDLKRKLNVLDEERNSFVGLERRISSISDFRTDYYNHQVKVIQDALHNADSGKYEKVSVPEKPWKVFGWEKEKKQYEELLSVIEQLNNHIDLYKEKRDETFGEHDFKLTTKSNQLYAKIGQKNEQNRDNLYALRDDEPMVRGKRAHDIVQENVDKQKNAKKARMEKAQASLREKGVVLGQKSGVIEADKKAKKIIYDKAIEEIMRKLRATPSNARMSEEDLMKIAKRLVAEKQK